MVLLERCFVVQEGSAKNPDMPEGGIDDFLNQMDIGDPNPNNHRKRFDGADDISEWFHHDKTDDWRQRD
jgi:hypothetical protein